MVNTGQPSTLETNPQVIPGNYPVIGKDPDPSLLEALKQTAASRGDSFDDSFAQDFLKIREKIATLYSMKDKQGGQLKQSEENLAITTPQGPDRQKRVEDKVRDEQTSNDIQSAIHLATQEYAKLLEDLYPEEIRMIIKATEVEGRIVEDITKGRIIARHLLEIDTGWEELIKKRVREYLENKAFFGSAKKEKAEGFEDQIEDWLFEAEKKGLTPTTEDYTMAQQIYDEWINNIKSNKSSYQNGPNILWLFDPYVPIAQGITPIR